jgi:hypothetical protein
MASKYSSNVGHFNGHGGAPEQYRWYCPMRHVQGYPGSHWMPPLGDYLLHITPAAATRATANDMTTKNGPTLLAILMVAVVRRYNTARIA